MADHYLVTGANGFIGRYMTEYLIGLGKTVTALSRTARPRVSPKETLLVEIAHDLARPLDAAAMPQVDVVVHCAANSGRSLTGDEELLRDNVAGTYNLARWVEKIGPRVLINLSSVSVHGKVKTSKLDHRTPIVTPSYYGLTKWLAEQVFAALCAETCVYSLRLPAVLGPGAPRHWVMGLIASALTDEPLQIYNPQSRFCNVVHVSDLCKFIVSLGETSGPSGMTAFPLASRSSMSIFEIAHFVRKSLKSNSLIEVQEQHQAAFCIDDLFARVGFGYVSLTTQDAIARQISEALTTGSGHRFES